MYSTCVTLEQQQTRGKSGHNILIFQEPRPAPIVQDSVFRQPHLYLTPLSQSWFAGTDSGATRSRGTSSNLALIFCFRSPVMRVDMICPMFPRVFRYPWCLKTRFSATWQLKSCHVWPGSRMARWKTVLFEAKNWCWEFGNCIRESYTALWPTWLLA